MWIPTSLFSGAAGTAVASLVMQATHGNGWSDPAALGTFLSACGALIVAVGGLIVILRRRRDDTEEVLLKLLKRELDEDEDHDGHGRH